MMKPQEAMERLLSLGGFPEPFLKGSEISAKRWRRSHIDRIIREDLLDLEQTREIKSIETLVDLLSERVGNAISYASLARDLEVSPHSIKKWIQILESLFVIFRVLPYTKNISRSILKEPKIYFYDLGRLKSGSDGKFENLIACALLKRIHFLEDTQGDHRSMFYVRDKEKHEVDFLTINDSKCEWLIEVKESNHVISRSLHYFSEKLNPEKTFQIVKNLDRNLQNNQIEIKQAAHWLSQLEC